MGNLTEQETSQMIEGLLNAAEHKLNERLGAITERHQRAQGEAQEVVRVKREEEHTIDGRIFEKGKVEKDVDRRLATKQALLSQVTAEHDKLTADVATARAFLSEAAAIMQQTSADQKKNEATILRLVGGSAS